MTVCSLEAKLASPHVNRWISLLAESYINTQALIVKRNPLMKHALIIDHAITIAG